MNGKNVKLEQGEIAVLRVDRPKSKNAVDFVTMDELEMAIETLEHDAGLRALIVTGGGDTFVSGGDLRSFQTLTTADSGQQMAERMGAILTRVSRLPVPVIAAVNGPALGGGTEVALACDLRVVAADAYFAFRQITMGIMTAWGGGPRLLKAIGPSRALYYLLTAERIGPEEAVQIGLAHRIAPAGQAMQQAIELAREIAAQPPLAVRAIKQTVRRIAGLTFEPAHAIEVQTFAQLWASADHDEAVNAYFARRQPVFQGK